MAAMGRNDHDITTFGGHNSATYNLIGLIVAALEDEVWLYGCNQLKWRVFTKDRNTIHK